MKFFLGPAISLQINVSPAWLMGYDVPREMTATETLLAGNGLSRVKVELIELITKLKPIQVHALLTLLRGLPEMNEKEENDG